MSTMVHLPKQPIRCMAGAFPMGDRDFMFSLVHTEAGFFIWEGRTIPDQFKKGDGHIYECLWDDERVEFRLVEENVRLKLLPQPIWPIDVWVMTPYDVDFYTIRNRLRELGKEPSRTDFEKLILRVAPYLKVGE